MARKPKQQGLPITCDVAINHVHLSEMDLGFFDSNCHLVPPLRSLPDRDALCTGLADGTIDAICSDHAPVDEDAKLLPFGQSEAGATGLELLLSLTYKWAMYMNTPLIDNPSASAGRMWWTAISAVAAQLPCRIASTSRMWVIGSADTVNITRGEAMPEVGSPSGRAIHI